MEEKSKLQDRLLSFLDKNYNILIILILIFALILRLKYLTINQAVWYDEAEYLSAAKAWAFGTPYELHFVRPPLLPFILAGLYKLGISEYGFRILLLIFSMFGILFTYLLGKELFDKKIALIATFIMSFFYLHIFYTIRILTDIPSTTFWLISLWLFWKGYVKKESKYYLWIFGLSFTLGLLMRFPLGSLGIVLLVYLFVTDFPIFLKNKNLWVSLAIFILSILPYSVWYYLTYQKIPILGASEFYTPVNQFINYFPFIPTLLQSPIPGISSIFPSIGNFFLLAFVIGLGIILFNLIMGYNLLRKDSLIKKNLFFILWIIIPFIYFGYFSGMAEDRYLFYILPLAFYIIGFALIKFYDYLKKYNKIFGLTVILFILISACYTQVQYADKLIKLKSTSYIQFKYAGEFIKQNSNPEDKIIASGIPQLTYYSDRRILYWQEKKQFETQIKNDKSIKYIVLSTLEGSPQWSYAWPEENKDKVIPIQAYFADKEKTKPIVVLYKILDR